MLEKLSRQIAICEFPTKSSIFDLLKKILLLRRLVLTYSLLAKFVHYQILFTELKSRY